MAECLAFHFGTYVRLELEQQHSLQLGSRAAAMPHHLEIRHLCKNRCLYYVLIVRLTSQEFFTAVSIFISVDYDTDKKEYTYQVKGSTTGATLSVWTSQVCSSAW